MVCAYQCTQRFRLNWTKPLHIGLTSHANSEFLNTKEERKQALSNLNYLNANDRTKISQFFAYCIKASKQDLEHCRFRDVSLQACCVFVLLVSCPDVLVWAGLELISIFTVMQFPASKVRIFRRKYIQQYLSF